MNPSLIAQLDVEIAETKAKLEALEKARAALLGHNGSTPASKAPESPIAGNPEPITPPGGLDRKRAPKGFLRAAVLKILASADAPEMHVRKLKEALIAASYPYSLFELSRTVNEMAAEGLLSVKPNGPWSTYRKAEPKQAKKKKARQ
jgi:hypothetical protein